ncbi:hypothetical protein J2X68_000940 [Streptomyces sp. 3330]|uniref:hypothetical protein n=1 Tax=Streptomyces sp. 3330 TaxID=2817755 RepID=UPI002861A036|nr:hypothetical protein [Streptomyces sp. 3330]MDR6974262.1 hypothetical protein [Streptomyces sp. 3330]
MRYREAHTGERDGGDTDGGRTHWRRSALMFVPCALAVGALGIALAEGAIAASFAVSGTAFKVSASEVTAQGVSSFPSSIGGSADDAEPVLLAAVKDGTPTTSPRCARPSSSGTSRAAPGRPVPSTPSIPRSARTA